VRSGGAGVGPSAPRLPHFFFVESALCYDRRFDLTLDETLLYLRFCCGYNPKREGHSLAGAQSAREDLSMSRGRFHQASKGLEKWGLIRTFGKGTSAPRTLIASMASPFSIRFPPVDGHSYQALKDVELILLPMPLIYGDPDLPEAALESLTEVDAVRLLLHCYLICGKRGALKSHRVWYEAAEGEAVFRLGKRDRLLLAIEPDKAARAGLQLVENELLCADGDVDSKGRGFLRLRHVVPDTGKEAAA
jgi:hypothetical protein